ncbi:MAG TPA: DinB family protein, partial [Symbiobacteriaceae bacterium]|nr:DinB family protein [Symbiobacteriaceae bacterium]
MPAQVDSVMQRARGIRTLIRAEVQGATPTALMQKAGDRWSARDVLIHLGNWEAEAVTWFGCLLNSEPIPQSSKPIDEWNAEHMAAYAELDAAGAVAYIEGTRQELEQVVTRITEEHLAGNPSFLGLLLMTPDHEIGHLH